MFYLCYLIKQASFDYRYLLSKMQDQKLKGLTAVTSRFYLNLNKPLGSGCYGKVYEGYDKEKKTVIAVKHLNNPEDFQAEIETLRDLSKLRHPYIMGFYGCELKEKDVFIFMEYCPNGMLTKLIDNGIEEQRVLDVFRQIVQGMCYMNAKGKMHRDLKPDNILIGVDMDTKISDFGLARGYEGLDITGQIGTPLYAGPEVYTNFKEVYNHNCDVWSAGCILYEMLTGKHPFNHVKTIYQLKEEWKLFEKGEKRIEYGPEFHPQWEFLTNLMLTYNFKKRPTFHDVLQILKKVDDNGTMRQEILNKKSGIKSKISSRATLVQNYLDFIDQKFNVLTNLSNALNGEKYSSVLHPIYQEVMIFVATGRYLAHMKKLIRSLKYKNIKFPNGEEVVDRNEQNNTINLLIEKYRINFETKFTKFQNHFKEKIIPKILAWPDKDKQNLKLIENTYKLVKEAEEGGLDIEDTYEEQCQKLLSHWKFKPTDQKLKSMTVEQLQIYLNILLVGFLSTQLPDSDHAKKNFVKNKLKDYFNSDCQVLMQNINRIRKQIK